MAEAWQGIRVGVHSDVRYLGVIRTLIRETAGLLGFTRDEASEIELAVTEALANVIRHCYGNCPEERMDVVFTFSGPAFEVQIDDYGKFVDPSCIKGRDLDDIRPGGLGVHLMRKMMDEVVYRENQWGGTSLVLRKRLPARSGPKQEGQGAAGHNG